MKQIYSIPSGMAFVLLLGVILSLPVSAQISQEACQTVLQDRTYEQMRREASIIYTIRNKVRGRGAAASTDTVPVFFTVFRDDSGNFADPEIDLALADRALEQLNEYFQPIQLVFVRLGEINYIDHTGFTDFSRHHHLARFSYLSTALNVYSKSGSSSFAQFPTTLGPVEAYDPNGPGSDRSNMLSLNSHHFLSTSFAHEMGHSYGLLHTFEGAGVYNNPLEPTPGYQQTFADHPYGEAGNSRRRELVIRQSSAEKPFALPNSASGGDFVDDTPAFCVSTNTYPDYYPDRKADDCNSYPFDQSRCNGCIVVDCDYKGNYVDYNGDTLINTDVSIRNLMSYTNCRSEFTPGQYERMAFYHEQVRQYQYDAGLKINFSDTVFFEDTRIPMGDVLLQVTHPGQNRYANATTNSNGTFQSILYEPWTSVNLLKAGSALDPTYRNSPWVEATVEEIIEHSYQREDWTDGVDERDLELLQQHLAGTNLLNGYRQLAADLDGNGMLTTADVQLLRQLIEGEINHLPAHVAPWNFLPAYIPEQHAHRFHENPFQMEISGVAYHRYAPYLEADWLFNAGALPAGLQGFHGIKMGDLNGSSHGLQNVEPENDAPGPIQIEQVEQPEPPGPRFTCFPNPTAGDIEVVFSATAAAKATLLITNRFFSSVYQQEVDLENGVNEFAINGTDFPAGVLVVMLKTPEGIFYKKVIKI